MNYHDYAEVPHLHSPSALGSGARNEWLSLLLSVPRLSLACSVLVHREELKTASGHGVMGLVLRLLRSRTLVMIDGILDEDDFCGYCVYCLIIRAYLSRV